jgi:hypothetical protein
MQRENRMLMIVTLAAVTVSCAARRPAQSIEVRTDDVERFFAVYDAAGARPTGEQLQREYLDRGTEGLRHLARARNVTGARIAQAIAGDPALYVNARSCLAVLPRVRDRLAQTFDRLLELYPEALRPPVTIVVSRGRPLAIAGPGDGVQIGLEGMCSDTAARVLGADLDDRFVRVIAHEYIHAQQAPALIDDVQPTVLERSLVEGVAEFVAEKIAGGVSNAAVAATTRNREREIEQRFAADVDKTDLGDWVDNTTADDVGQLGYWVGYRIAKAFHQRAPDKRLAIRQMIELTDAHAFLAASGWHPAIALDR